MKMFKKSILASCAALLVCAQVNATELSSDLDRESYAIGASVGNYMSNQVHGQLELGAQINMDAVVDGFVDALKDQSKISEEDVVTLLNQRLKFLNAKREVELAQLKQQNKDAGDTYRIENKLKDGVTVTASGLQYEVLTMGKGSKPKPEDVVTFNFVGKLLDGTEFESTYAMNKPARMAMMTLIDGWQEGLQLMPEGSTFRFTLPPELAYGEEGAGAIPPQSTLVFDIELVKVEVQKDKPMGMGMGMGGMKSAH
ncbi:peptidyl-prolyl cis-trans isomerase [Shewanella sp. NFH-SH190041]|uniref:FKBP-type peptidyl-prolyl cis-trans isomerase n=1 Tax=Shewanella sp. NFH-SH190041 TaxID=2950245 RepID=UPI0021C2E1D1|nr:FKBP-type peptidyl-prolyl cis-trans isomerase [Shewanella sp. NFH-SH190041]BDM62989.1 peptidyl-prolyl cis-trans isomerase [Shewanella sp. NFH-SH190041]